MLKLEGKTALVTGSSSGIGLAIAQRFADEDAHVFIIGRRQEQLDNAAAVLGTRCTAILGDVTKSEDLDRLFDAVDAAGAKLDILVTSAGISEFSTLEETTPEHVDAAFGLNVSGMLFTVQRAVRRMTNGGAIVLVGSVAGSIANPGYGTYSATKAAVRSYARTWTAELAPRGIRVNTLSPGPTDTPMFARASDEVRSVLTGRIPFGRMGLPQEVADAALFLASDDSRYVGGAELVIDGGMIA